MVKQDSQDRDGSESIQAGEVAHFPDRAAPIQTPRLLWGGAHHHIVGGTGEALVTAGLVAGGGLDKLDEDPTAVLGVAEVHEGPSCAHLGLVVKHANAGCS